MNTLRDKIKNHKNDMPYFVAFFCVTVLTHLCIREYMGDAPTYFNKILEQYSLFDAIAMRYQTWTSRIIIEIPLYWFSYDLRVQAWAIVDILMFVILLLSLMKLTHYKHNKLVVFLILLYPMIEMASAGWIATTINYLWPLALGCASFVLLDKLYHNEKVNVLSIVFFMICELFSTNFETFSVYYFVILTFVTVVMFLEHKHTLKSIVIIGIQYLISIGNIYLALSCPGNWIRNTAEVTRWMIDFPTLTAIDKILLGVEDTMARLIHSNLLFLVFALMIFVIVLKKRAALSKIVVAAIPFVSVLLMTFFSSFTDAYLSSYKSMFQKTININPLNFNSPLPYIAFIFFVTIMTISVIALLNCGKDLKSSILMVLVFTVGFATRVIMGFSPTLYASSLRTFIFLDFSMIFCIIKLIDDNKELFVYEYKCEKYISAIGLVIIVFYSLNSILAISALY